MGSEESNEKIVAEEEMHADKLAKFVEDAEKLFEGTSKSALAAAKSAEAAAAANPNAKRVGSGAARIRRPRSTAPRQVVT